VKFAGWDFDLYFAGMIFISYNAKLCERAAELGRLDCVIAGF
jgi:hypothetical protein